MMLNVLTSTAPTIGQLYQVTLTRIMCGILMQQLGSGCDWVLIHERFLLDHFDLILGAL